MVRLDRTIGVPKLVLTGMPMLMDRSSRSMTMAGYSNDPLTHHPRENNPVGRHSNTSAINPHTAMPATCGR